MGSFPSYDEAQAEAAAAAAQGEEGRYVPLSIVRHGDVSKTKYFDKVVYKKRLAAVLAPWLLDSNRRAAAAGTTAVCVTTCLGLGAWGVDKCQRVLMHEVYAELLSSLLLPAVSDFIATTPAELGVCNGGEWLADGSNAVRIRLGKADGKWRNPATRLSGADEGKLLCAMCLLRSICIHNKSHSLHLLLGLNCVYICTGVGMRGMGVLTLGMSFMSHTAC